VVEGVTERTGGVPLFVEEVTRLLLEGGAHREGFTARRIPLIDAPPRDNRRAAYEQD
jgi:hypothetical protein